MKFLKKLIWSSCDHKWEEMDSVYYPIGYNKITRIRCIICFYVKYKQETIQFDFDEKNINESCSHTVKEYERMYNYLKDSEEYHKVKFKWYELTGCEKFHIAAKAKKLNDFYFLREIVYQDSEFMNNFSTIALM
jgi:hypothetical protein